MTKLTKAEADDLFQFLDEGDYTEFEWAPALGDRPAKMVKVYGASAAEYVKFVVRRIPAVAELYIDGVRQGVRQAAADAEAKAKAAAETVDVPFGTRAAPAVVEASTAPVAEDPDADLDVISRAILDGVRENIAEGALEEKAALIAVCMGRPGDEAFERNILRHPRFQDLADLANQKTRGADPFGFSGDVNALLMGRPAAPEAPADQPTETAA